MKWSDLHSRKPTLAAGAGVYVWVGVEGLKERDKGQTGGGWEEMTAKGTGTGDTPLGDLTGAYVHVGERKACGPGAVQGGGPSLDCWPGSRNQTEIPRLGEQASGLAEEPSHPFSQEGTTGDFWDGKEAGTLSRPCLQTALSPLHPPPSLPLPFPVWPCLTRAYWSL